MDGITLLMESVMSNMTLTWSSLQVHYPFASDQNVSLHKLEAWFSEYYGETGRWHRTLKSVCRGLSRI